MMAAAIVIRLVFLLLALLRQQTSVAAQSGFILQYCPGTLASPTPSCTVVAQPMPKRDDYTYTPGIGAHKVHRKSATWNTARKICASEGGHLVIINSVAESQHIAELARNADRKSSSEWPNYFHVGSHNLFNHDEWVTIHSEPLDVAGFNEWDRGQPDRGDREACAGINYANGKLDDSSCFAPLDFICELPNV